MLLSVTEKGIALLSAIEAGLLPEMRDSFDDTRFQRFWNLYQSRLSERRVKSTEPFVPILKPALVCAARHFVAAHESAVRNVPVDFGAVCTGCSCAGDCRGDWFRVAAPVFEAAQVFPCLMQGDQS